MTMGMEELMNSGKCIIGGTIVSLKLLIIFFPITTAENILQTILCVLKCFSKCVLWIVSGGNFQDTFGGRWFKLKLSYNIKVLFSVSAWLIFSPMAQK